MKSLILAVGAVILLLAPFRALAQDRHVEPPPVIVSPDLSAPWVLQLQEAPPRTARRQRPQTRQHYRPREPWRAVERSASEVQLYQRAQEYSQRHRRQLQRQQGQENLRTAAVAPRVPGRPSNMPAMDPLYLPKVVEYDGNHQPGTLVIDTEARFLFLVMEGNKARRYGVGVGKPGFEWAGTHRVSQKREWPDWRPPSEMIEREAKNGRTLPTFVKGGPQNPLGARALYLGSTLYRIHGTNAPWTIGQAVSSGCIRMRNEDVIDLYERVPVGAKVVVI